MGKDEREKRGDTKGKKRDVRKKWKLKKRPKGDKCRSDRKRQRKKEVSQKSKEVRATVERTKKAGGIPYTK